MSTVTAISTPTGRGAIGLVRVTGENAIEISDKIFKAISGNKLATLKGYTAAYGDVIFDGEVIDEGVATVFRSRKSYTG